MFEPLLQQLSQQLQELPFSHGLVRLHAEITWTLGNAPLLDWLNAQPTFPHFYWQSRDTQETLLSIGAVMFFDQLETAEQFSHTHQQQLVGGVQFEGRVRFVLPRLLLTKKAEKLTACLTLTCWQDREICQQLFANPAKITVCSRQMPEIPELLLQHTACSFSEWQQNVQQAIATFQQGELNKVVLANATTLTFREAISPYHLLKLSLNKNLGCYHFLWSETGEQTFIGSSPERLYQRQGRQFYTEALAGTVAVSPDREETERNALWLMSDHKNIYENLLVVDDICANLADCAEDIQVGDVQIKRLYNVQHLHRKISAVLAEKVTDADCLVRIHPTAAVAGLPRPQAKDFIRHHETFPRQWYAGTLGYFRPEQAEFCVTLRSALIQGNQITIYAGAGIIEGSDPHAEWAEVERKSRAIWDLL